MSRSGSRTQGPSGTWGSVARQCLNSRVPGYSGFIPSYEAEDIFGHTQAGAGRSALKAQRINMDRRSEVERKDREFETPMAAPNTQGHPSPSFDPASGHDWYKTDPGASFGDTDPSKSRQGTMRSQPPADNSPMASTLLPSTHSFIPRRAEAPCRVKIQRNHWVPPVPGYNGFVPGRYSENICGGGLTHTAKMCARAISERRPPETEHLRKTVQDDIKRERLVNHFHETNNNDTTENYRLIENYKKHCSTKIPGYTGHIPRKDGDSVFGATACRANLVCSDIAVDKLQNPYDHFEATVAPQFPPPRQCYP